MSALPKVWSAEEDDTLWFDTLAGMPRKKTLAKLPDRTMYALYTRCEVLELRLTGALRRRHALFDRLWLYTDMTQAEIGEMLGYSAGYMSWLRHYRGLPPRRSASTREEPDEG